MDRRDFLRHTAGLALGASLVPLPGCFPRASGAGAHPLFRVSLAQWSLHRTLRSGALDPIDFPAAARERYGLEAVEYVNTFYMDRALERPYLTALRRRAADAGVRSLLIMCDGEGALGDPEEASRLEAVENHRKWVEAAAFLGCHSIRVNASSRGSYDEQLRLAADGLHRLCELADDHDIDVLVENHGGLSSNGAWLAAVIRAADHPRAGTLPDFGNFRVQADPEEWYDRYRGVAELMPFARAVSAKSHEFDERGDETGTDYRRMMRIVLDAGYRGWVGIEYEGDQLSEDDGIHATTRLLERVRQELEPDYR
jgi:L-ribulose-5-phosphate 3-epimerase